MPNTQSNEDQRLIISELRDRKQTLKNAPALNGGFDKLIASIDSIKEKQEATDEVIKELRAERHEIRNYLSQAKMKTELSDKYLEKVDKTLFDPDNGVYARLRDTEAVVDELGQKRNDALERHTIEDIKNFESLTTKLDKIIEAQQPLADTSQRIVSVAGGKDLDDLKAVIDFKRNFGKIYWLLIAAIFSSVGKVVFDMISHHS